MTARNVGGTTDRNSLSARQANGAAMLVEVDAAAVAVLLLVRLIALCVGAVYYKQIRKSEQRPPLHLRTADLVPQPRTPLCPKSLQES